MAKLTTPAMILVIQVGIMELAISPKAIGRAPPGLAAASTMAGSAAGTPLLATGWENSNKMYYH